MFSAREFSIGRAGSTPPHPAVVLVAGLLLTFAAFMLVQVHEREDDRALFDSEVAQFMGALRQSFGASEVLLQSGAGMLTAHADLGANEWQMFVDGDDLKARFPGFQGIAFLKVRADQAWNTGSEPEALELAMIEPNGAYTLSQLAGGAPGRAAMARARDLDAPIRTKKVMLTRSGGGEGAGVLIYLPVANSSSGRGDASLVGYVAMPFVVSNLIKGLMQGRFEEVKQHLRIEIFDGRVLDASALLYDSAQSEGYAPPDDPRVTAQFVVDRFGTEWTYRFSSLPLYERTLGSYIPVAVLAGGLFVTALVSWLCMQLSAGNRLAAEANRDSAALKAELRHRVHNTLAVVQSLANRSLDDGSSADEGREQFSSRLSALARAHALLTENAWSGTSIGELVRSELAPLMNRAHAHGPIITLGPQVAQSLALVIHELASDAVRRGVQTIYVEWEAASEPEPAAIVTWNEKGAAQSPQSGLADQIVAHGFVMKALDQRAGDSRRLSFAVPLN